MCHGNASKTVLPDCRLLLEEADEVDHRRYAELFMHQELPEQLRDLCARTAK